MQNQPKQQVFSSINENWKIRSILRFPMKKLDKTCDTQGKKIVYDPNKR